MAEQIQLRRADYSGFVQRAKEANEFKKRVEEKVFLQRSAIAGSQEIRNEIDQWKAVVPQK